MSTKPTPSTFLPMIKQVEQKAEKDILNELLVFLLQNKVSDTIRVSTIVKNFIKPKLKQLKTK